MTMNLDLVGQALDPVEVSWTSKDALLYALGVGAGADPLVELSFTTENTRSVPQQVLPTFAASLVGGGDIALGDFDPARVLHGAQSVETFGALPTDGLGIVRPRLSAIHDKGSAAVAILESTLEDLSGVVLARTEASVFVRGEGGFGGSRGEVEPWEPPDRPADHVVQYATRRDQALVFRLSGDRNPLHSDPAVAADAGFDQPILHGMSSYGFTGRALLHDLCGSDPARFRRMSARFAATVNPGDTLTIHMWDDGEVSRFRTLVGDTVVLDRGLLSRWVAPPRSHARLSG
jgi:acyl dehydratase